MSSSSISSLLNDSDDVFLTPTLKRKVRPPSPSAKRTKNSKNVKLSQTLLTQMQKNPEKTADKETPVFEDGLTTKSAEEPFTCPLCKKILKNSIQGISHLKQCGKKKKIAMGDLQRALNGTKTTKAPSKETIMNQNNLSLAAAISLSVTENTVRPELLVDKSVYDSQLATLERFGFTSTSAAALSRRKKSNRVSVLRSRSEEDRRKLIAEKCAAILFDMEENSGFSSPRYCRYCPVTRLWSYAGNSAPYTLYYVPALSEYIAPISEDSPRRGMRQRRRSYSPVGHPNDDTEQFIRHPSWPPAREPCLGRWDHFVGNSLYSDAIIATTDGLVPVHRVVLAACCPSLILAGNYATRLQIPTAALLSMLRFIYAGELGPIEEPLHRVCEEIAHSVFGRADLAARINHNMTAQFNRGDADTISINCSESEVDIVTLSSDSEPDPAPHLSPISPAYESLSSSSYNFGGETSPSEGSPNVKKTKLAAATPRNGSIPDPEEHGKRGATPLNDSIPDPEENGNRGATPLNDSIPNPEENGNRGATLLNGSIPNPEENGNRGATLLNGSIPYPEEIGERCASPK